MSTTESLTTVEMSQLAGISLRQLQWWDEQKIVSPAQVGHVRRYSVSDTRLICILADLRCKGVTLKLIRKFKPLIVKSLNRTLPGAVLMVLTDKKQVWFERTDASAIALIKSIKNPVILVAARVSA